MNTWQRLQSYLCGRYEGSRYGVSQLVKASSCLLNLRFRFDAEYSDGSM